MRKAILVGSLLTASVAQAQKPSAPKLSNMPSTVGPLLPYIARSFIVTAGSPSDPAYSTPTGVGYEGVGSIFIERNDGQFLCSGALFGGGAYMLTAAHCLANDLGQLVTTKTTSVFFPAGAPAGTREFITSNQFYVNPMYTGEVIDAHDVAVIKLGSAPSATVRASSYSLFSGNPFGQVGQLVGSGRSGNGSATQNGGFLQSDRRTALNRVDFSWTDAAFGGYFGGFFGSADPYGLVADFDNGNSANDASCIMGGFFGTSAFCGIGQGSAEGGLGSGDSGGPLFINGQIAGVASYGVSFGTGVGDVDNALNSSYGEFSGWASTSYNAQWLGQFNTVPEPSSFALVAVGMLVVAAGARRRTTR